jgi:hypothetical protein
MSFINSSVLVLDDTGAVHDYQASVSSPITIGIPAGASGFWTWVLSRAGFTKLVQTFDATGGGNFEANTNQQQRQQPSGVAMFTGSVDGNLTVSFDLSNPAQPRCFIDVGDATVHPQAILDEVETALETQDGCRFLALTNGAVVDYASLPAGEFLFMDTGYRIRRAAIGDVNATVGAFVVSADGVVVDSANGSVTFLSSPLTSSDVALAVWGANRADFDDPGTTGRALRTINENVKKASLLVPASDDV